MNKRFNFQELHAIIAALRGENGCPWDRAQTHESMKSCTIEEAYEVNQAVTDLSKTGDSTNLCEELGDLLLQVMLHSQIAEDNGEFTLEDVIDGIARKMIRRHPHVFGDTTYRNTEEQQADWEAIKARERAGKQTSSSSDSCLEEVPIAFPALIRSQKVLKKSYKHDIISFQDEDIFKEMLQSVIDLQMAAAHPEEKDIFSEKLGKSLFAICKLAAKYNIHSEMALSEETEKFIQNQQKKVENN